MQTENVPGAAVALVCRDGVLARGLGVTLQGGQQPVTATTRFQTASITKMFTAATALALAEEGIVDIDQPISEWVPYTNTDRPFGQPVTLRHLLSHTAGYPTYWVNGVYEPYEIPDLFVNNADAPLWAPPGALWLYSNLGFSLAGLVLQEAAGEGFAHLVRTHVLEPAQMDTARMDAAVVVQEGDFAYGHTASFQDAEPIDPLGAYYDASAYGPMGGLWASVSDMAAWARASMQKDEAILSVGSWELLRTPVSLTKQNPGESYALGLAVDDFHSPSVLYHTGSTVGFFGWWYLVPERDVALVMLTNCDWWISEPYRILERALEDMASIQPGNREDYRPDPARTAGLLGTYDSPELGRFSVEESAGSLYVTFESTGERLRLEPEVEDGYYFFSNTGGGPMTFWRNASGVADYAATMDGVGIRVQ